MGPSAESLTAEARATAKSSGEPVPGAGLRTNLSAWAGDADATPLMRQYWDLKSQAPDALLFFRMGDFYEVFAEDAVEAARILEITLTSRDKNKANPMPMAGVPHHSVQGYIQKLLAHGKKVAIGEQTEDPEEAKKRGSKSIVRREIIRVLTPAVQFESEGSERAFLATAIRVDEKTKSSPRYTLALIEPSTGETRLSAPMDERGLLAALPALPIRHFLRLGHDLPESVTTSLQGRESVLFEDLPSNRLSLEEARLLLNTQYGTATLEPFLGSQSDLASSTHALGLLVHYLLKSQRISELGHLRTPRSLQEMGTMAMGPRTLEHLDIFNTDGSSTPTLFAKLNRTKSSLGAREMRNWVAQPSKSLPEIERRQAAIRELAGEGRKRASLQKIFSETYDLERILARVSTGLANPRDSLALGKTLANLGSISSLLDSAAAEMLGSLRSTIVNGEAATRELAAEILRTQLEDAPFHSRDGGIFQRGTDPELDRLLTLTEDGQRWLVDLETQEREKTGIPSLKVRYNRVFGYYIEITSAHLKSVPAHYQRKQTTVGAERFFTEELKRFEEEILSAGDKKKALEQELFGKLLARIREAARPITEIASALATLDVLCALSEFATEPGWCFPELNSSADLEIEAGRHPLVDQGRGSFVPNDFRLDASRAVLLITGPNMGGKSTLMRQVALIVWLGQMGAPVPARAARWGVVSSVYTRIGAHDAIARGQSTFMVEMTELAHLLHHADARSLVVLDEIGRGTSTYDGMSVAWATLEWIIKNLGCRTLFATHYHELTKLPTFLPRVANAHMAVESTRGTLKFLYTLRDGATNESFGIQVAKLAGLPAPVIQRAWKVLEQLEADGGGNASAGGQLGLFGGTASAVEISAESSDDFEASFDPESALTPTADPRWEELKGALAAIDLAQTTPLQALQLLDGFQRMAAAPSEHGN